MPQARKREGRAGSHLQNNYYVAIPRPSMSGGEVHTVPACSSFSQNFGKIGYSSNLPLTMTQLATPFRAHWRKRRVDHARGAALT